MVTGTGICWGEAYMFSMCFLEETQWIKSQAINAAEFFHGALEVVQEDTPLIIIKGED